ncbi:MAG TPA: LUD domain-containing protein [Bacteroidia bacterium]|nr:LUD domain-containing protein [Bacteroidota bacterium]HQV99259.1 LUD domain-containing protein [Bacteroidia bacterium]
MQKATCANHHLPLTTHKRKMQDATSREKILKKIRQALIHKTTARFPNIDWEKNVYANEEVSLEEKFATAFTKVGGQFVFCENEMEFLENVIMLAQENKWKQFYCQEKKITDYMDQIEFPYTKEDKTFPEGMVAITSCEALVARLGAVIISSKQGSGRKLFVVPTIHVVMAYTSQLVPELKDALSLIKSKYNDQLPSMIASLNGPSRTADIEKTLVTPAHGPRDIFVFVIDDAK